MQELELAREKALLSRLESFKPEPKTHDPILKALTNKLLEPLALRITSSLKMIVETPKGYPPFIESLSDLSPYSVSYFTLLHGTLGAFKGDGLNARAAELGRALLKHTRMKDFQKKHPKLFASLSIRAPTWTPNEARNQINTLEIKGLLTGGWPQRELTFAGVWLLRLMADALPSVMLIRTEYNQRRQRLKLVPAEGFAEAYERLSASSSLVKANGGIMLCPPLEASSENLFHGALLPELQVPTIKAKTTRDSLQIHRAMKPEPFEALNRVQGVGYQINEFVLGVAQWAWEKDLCVGKLPRRSLLDIPSYPFKGRRVLELSPTEKLEFSRWLKAHRSLQRRNNQTAGRKWTTQAALMEAEALKGAPFWFPCRLDFRGRLYPTPRRLTYQGSELHKALLSFASEGAVTDRSLFWQGVSVANAFGRDKDPFTDRYEWTIRQIESFKEMVLDPRKHRGWMEADEPWLALAAIDSLVGSYFYDRPPSVPVHVDGTCSGLQHYSALLLDPEGAKATNLMPGNRQDIYQVVADRVDSRLRASEAKPDKLWRGKVNRAIAKRPVMTYPYSATAYGMAHQILDVVTEMDDTELGAYLQVPAQEVLPACIHLGSVLYEVIGSVVQAAQQARQWIADVSTAAAREQTEVTWMTPAGIPLVNGYRKPRVVKGSIFTGFSRHTIKVYEPGALLDSRKIAQSCAPNLIHSLDAAHLLATVREFEGPVMPIHDSFGTLPHLMDSLSLTLRDTFVGLYENNEILESYRDSIQKATGDATLPPPPPKGDFDLNLVRKSMFCFS